MAPSVLVVGAGPTGLTAAVELARRGLHPAIIEKRPTPSPLSRAVGILPRSMRILGPSGVATAIEAEAIRFSGLIFHRGRTPLARLPMNFDDRSRLWGLAQDRTEAHLRHALESYGVQVRYGVAFRGLTQDAGGVTVETSEGRERHDHVIGADGSLSAVRQALRIRYEGHDLPEDWSIADVEAHNWPNPTCFNGYLLPRGQVCVVVPMEATRFRVIASQPDALKALPVRMEVTRVNRSGAFTISVRQAERYRDGRVFLAGDAAHAHSPVGGRGMNLGIADAADLAERLGDGGLEGYEAARRPEGAHVIALSERGRKAAQARTPGGRKAVTLALRAGQAFPPLGRLMIRQLLSG